jgi:hypothetical protein
MSNISWGGAMVSGLIGAGIGLLITWIVSLIISTTDLQWSLIVVGIASFSAAFSGFIAGTKQ